MPKFNGQNKKRNDPRYFLRETTEEADSSWEKYDDLMANAGASAEEWQAPWNSTEDMINKLAAQAREASKAIEGYRMDVEEMTISQLRDLLHSMSHSDVQRGLDAAAQGEKDRAIGMQDDEFDNSPKSLGMGRLKEIIKGELDSLLEEMSKKK